MQRARKLIARRSPKGTIGVAMQKEVEPLPFTDALDALADFDTVYQNLAEIFAERVQENGQFPESIEEVDEELRMLKHELQVLNHLVLARLPRLDVARKALRQARRAAYLKKAPFKLGDQVCYAAEPDWDDTVVAQPRQVVRGVLTDYVVGDRFVQAVVDGVLVSAPSLHAVDAMTRLGELIQAESEALRQAGQSPTTEPGSSIYFLTERYGNTQNAVNKALNPNDRDSADDRSFDSGELDRHDQNHDHPGSAIPNDINEHHADIKPYHGPITVEPSDVVVEPSDAVTGQFDELSGEDTEVQ